MPVRVPPVTLQGRPAERKISHDDNGSHGVCGLGAPHIKALPDAAQPSLQTLTISCLRVAPGKFLTPGLTSLQVRNQAGTQQQPRVDVQCGEGCVG